MGSPAGRYVTHIHLLEPPDKCCHGLPLKPFDEKSCLVCFAPDLFPGACPTRCLHPMETVKGPPSKCNTCKALRARAHR